jgi:hypothetical protein
MRLPIKIGDEVFYPDAIVLLKDRDQMIESVYRGNTVEVVAQTILCNVENRPALQQALTEGWEFFCAILPIGQAKFLLKEAEWLEAAQKIAESIDKDCFRKMPDSDVEQ